MDLRSLRQRIKSLPLIGPLAHRLYLMLRFKEGEVLTIEAGPLEGMRWKRFMRTFWPGYVTGEYEPLLLRAILREAKPGGVFFDVGANAGLMSLAGARAVGDVGSVFSFEPHPVTVKQLRAQLQVNGFTNVEVVEAAVSEAAGFAEFEDDGPSDALALASVGCNEGRTIRVRTVTIDEFSRERGAPDVVKIDVEGADMLVLRGARETLSTARPTVIMELHAPEVALEYGDFMASLGYEHFDLDGNRIPGPIRARHVVSKAR